MSLSSEATAHAVTLQDVSINYPAPAHSSKIGTSASVAQLILVGRVALDQTSSYQTCFIDHWRLKFKNHLRNPHLLNIAFRQGRSFSIHRVYSLCLLPEQELFLIYSVLGPFNDFLMNTSLSALAELALGCARDTASGEGVQTETVAKGADFNIGDTIIRRSKVGFLDNSHSPRPVSADMD
ncbi:MAG: hypothetical protein M1837_007039 [Sclerophora amabilis]|nr:MAG: hypothetical protein M1837_007039 [Sclerophora amabilis]